ncbi:transcriptional regulator, SARP family protein [Pelomyxa schiedti]|nr:transcriptional regulator, SARP family protein [Pelomyxa schiedti]
MAAAVADHQRKRLYYREEIVEVEEDKEHEFKAANNTEDPTTYIKSIAVKYLNAFLNANGGTIYFGVNDDGKAVGVILDRAARDNIRLSIDSAVSHFSPEVDPDMYSIAFIPVVERPSQDPSSVPEKSLAPATDTYIVEMTIHRGRASVYTDGVGKNAKAYVRREGSITELSPRSIDDRRSMGRPVFSYSVTNPATQVVGREHEMNIISSFISAAPQGIPIVVSIFGLPYVGKSTVAQHIARTFKYKFPDFTCHINMKGFSTSFISVTEAMAGVYRVLHPNAPTPSNSTEAAALFQSCFVNKKCILFVENVGTVDQVKALVPTNSAACVIIVTSRKDLGLDASLDNCYSLQVKLGALQLTDAAALLRSLVKSVSLSQPDAEKLASVACCMPQLIRILACEVNAKHNPNVTEVIEQLALKGGISSLVSECLGNVVAREETARYVLPLVVFRGSFDASAACSVLNEEYTAVHKILQSLLEYSLLDFDPVSVRYFQCEAVRSHALQQLKNCPGELKVWTERFIKHYLRILAHIENLVLMVTPDDGLNTSNLSSAHRQNMMEATTLLAKEERNMETMLQYCRDLCLGSEVARIVFIMSSPKVLAAMAVYSAERWRGLVQLFDQRPKSSLSVSSPAKPSQKRAGELEKKHKHRHKHKHKEGEKKKKSKKKDKGEKRKRKAEPEDAKPDAVGETTAKSSTEKPDDPEPVTSEVQNTGEPKSTATQTTTTQITSKDAPASQTSGTDKKSAKRRKDPLKIKKTILSLIVRESKKRKIDGMNSKRKESGASTTAEAEPTENITTNIDSTEPANQKIPPAVPGSPKCTATEQPDDINSSKIIDSTATFTTSKTKLKYSKKLKKTPETAPPSQDNGSTNTPIEPPTSDNIIRESTKATSEPNKPMAEPIKPAPQPIQRTPEATKPVTPEKSSVGRGTPRASLLTPNPSDSVSPRGRGRGRGTRGGRGAGMVGRGAGMVGRGVSMVPSSPTPPPNVDPISAVLSSLAAWNVEKTSKPNDKSVSQSDTNTPTPHPRKPTPVLPVSPKPKTTPTTPTRATLPHNTSPEPPPPQGSHTLSDSLPSEESGQAEPEKAEKRCEEPRTDMKAKKGGKNLEAKTTEAEQDCVSRKPETHSRKEDSDTETETESTTASNLHGDKITATKETPSKENQEGKSKTKVASTKKSKSTQPSTKSKPLRTTKEKHKRKSAKESDQEKDEGAKPKAAKGKRSTSKPDTKHAKPPNPKKKRTQVSSSTITEEPEVNAPSNNTSDAEQDGSS